MSLVELDLSGHLAVVELNDPARRNALTTEMVTELIATFDAIEVAGGVRAVVLCAAGPVFCAGADRSLLATASASPERAEATLGAVYEGFLRVARCPLPTIAAVTGPAVGAGLNLAIACDVRLASPQATFDPRFLSLGLHPGGGHTWLLQRIVSPQTAAAMLLCSQVLDADAAQRHGLVYEVVPDGNVVERAKELAGRAATVDRELLSRVKATLGEITSLPSLDDAVARELVDQIWSITRDGAATRVTTRPPRAPRADRPTPRR